MRGPLRTLQTRYADWKHSTKTHRQMRGDVRGEVLLDLRKEKRRL